MELSWNFPLESVTYSFLPLEMSRRLYETLIQTQNSSQIFELKTHLWKSKQNDHGVTRYYNELVALWQELNQCYDDVWENSIDYACRKKREEHDKVYMF